MDPSNVSCDLCNRKNVEIVCSKCNVAKYCSDECGQSDQHRHQLACDVLIAAKTDTMSRPATHRGPAFKEHILPQSQHIGDYALRTLPTVEQLSKDVPLSESVERALMGAPFMQTNPVMAAHVVGSVKRYRNAVYSKALVQKWWKNVFAKAGATPLQIESIALQWESAERTFSESIATLSQDVQTGNLSALHGVSDQIRAIIVSSTSILANVDEAKKVAVDMIVHADDALASVYASHWIDLAAQRLDDIKKNGVEYYKNDAETRALGFEPNPMWEGTDNEIATRIKTGRLQKPTWWDSRYNWVYTMIKRGTAVPRIFKKGVNPVHIGANGASDDDDDYDDDEYDDDSYDDDLAEREGVLFVQDKGETGEPWYLKATRKVFSNRIIHSFTQGAGSPSNNDNNNYDPDADDIEYTHGLQHHDTQRFNADARTRLRSHQVKFIQLEESLQSKWSEMPVTMSGSFFTTVYRWLGTKWIGEGVGALLTIGAFAGVILLAYDWAHGFAKKAQDNYNTVAKSFLDAKKSVTTQKEAIAVIIPNLENAMTNINEAMAQIPDGMETTALNIQFVKELTKNGGLMTVESVRGWLSASIPMMRESMAAATVPIQKRWIEPFENTLRDISDPKLAADAIQGLILYLKGMTLGNVANLSEEQQLASMKAMIDTGRVLRVMLSDTKASIENAQEALGALSNATETVSSALNDGGDVMSGRLAITAFKTLNAGTYSEELVADMTGVSGMGGKARQALSILMQPGVLFMTEMHKWIRSQEGMRITSLFGSEMAASILFSNPNFATFTGTFLIFNHWQIGWIFSLLRRLVRWKRPSAEYLDRVLSELTKSTHVTGATTSTDVLEQIFEGTRTSQRGVPLSQLRGDAYGLVRARAMYRMMGGSDRTLSVLSSYAPFVGGAMVAMGHAWDLGIIRSSARFMLTLPQAISSTFNIWEIVKIGAISLPGAVMSVGAVIALGTYMSESPRAKRIRAAGYIGQKSMTLALVEQTPVAYAAGRATYEYWYYIMAFFRNLLMLYQIIQRSVGLGTEYKDAIERIFPLVFRKDMDMNALVKSITAMSSTRIL